MRWFLLALLALPAEALAAYAQSAVTYVRQGSCVLISYAETDVAASSEAVVNLDWVIGDIVLLNQTLTAGSGATINTKIGRAASFTVSTQNHIATADTTGAHINEPGHTYFYAAGSKLYLRASPNAGSDNAVSTEILVCKGVL